MLSKAATITQISQAGILSHPRWGNAPPRRSPGRRSRNCAGSASTRHVGPPVCGCPPGGAPQLVSRSGVTVCSGAGPLNERYLLSVIVDVPDIQQATFGEPPPAGAAAVRQLYARYATALRNYVEQFCPTGRALMTSCR
jgi:hypothetical protein